MDEVHGLPFFTPFYVKERKVVLICEVAGKLWKEMFGPLFGSLGRTIEILFLRFLYKKIQFLTISRSSKEELMQNGVKAENITVLPMGLNLPKTIMAYRKEKNPTLIFLGRLSKPKGVEDAIRSLKLVLGEVPNACLWIVGRGEDDYIRKLKEMIKSLGLDEKITLYGFVSESKKFELLARAHVLVMPSIKEGWGLIVPEAYSVGTVSVVYNSPGLRDVLKNNRFKKMTSENTPEALAEEVLSVLKDKSFFEKPLRPNLDEFSWDNTAKEAFKILQT